MWNQNLFGHGLVRIHLFFLGMGPVVTWRNLLTWQVEAALEGAEVDVDDVSHQHAGHAGVAKGSSETHFK